MGVQHRASAPPCNCLRAPLTSSDPSDLLLAICCTVFLNSYCTAHSYTVTEKTVGRDPVEWRCEEMRESWIEKAYIRRLH